MPRLYEIQGQEIYETGRLRMPRLRFSEDKEVRDARDCPCFPYFGLDHDPRRVRPRASHEIGHEYWSEWVLDPDDPASLWIAMGIFADTEYMTARGFDPNRRTDWMGNYINAIPMSDDTTLDMT
jgi:hypothetical protein